MSVKVKREFWVRVGEIFASKRQGRPKNGYFFEEVYLLSKIVRFGVIKSTYCVGSPRTRLCSKKINSLHSMYQKIARWFSAGIARKRPPWLFFCFCCSLDLALAGKGRYLHTPFKTLLSRRRVKTRSFLRPDTQKKVISKRQNEKREEYSQIDDAFSS